jgi:hypothetical protein
MNIYLISQFENNGCDTHDSAVVIAADVEAARHTHPCDRFKPRWDSVADAWVDKNGRPESFGFSTWTAPKNVEVKLMGSTERKRAGVILASFNAG